MTDLKSISPVRKLTVEDFMKVAKAIEKEPHLCNEIDYQASAFRLLSRYESLTSRVLCKEMFVVDEREFTNPMDGEQDRGMYEAALKKVWFAGFENLSNETIIGGDNWQISMPKMGIWVSGIDQYVYNATVADFIHLIDRYNRTASTPIKLEWTENFIKEWLND